jgi:hypothetical protein
MPPSDSLPPRPDLVLRIGFAGNRNLPADTARLDDALDAILRIVARELAEVWPHPTDRAASTKIARFYSDTPPCLRLVTGLAEGGDTHAAAALDRLRQRESARPAAAAAAIVSTELAAVLPFDTATYRESRGPEFRESFDRQHAQCVYVLELDGIYEPGTAEKSPLHAQRRAHAYRVQAALLLRHVDILIAAADSAAPGRAGGTLETISEALAFGMPVAFIELGAMAIGAAPAVHIIEPGTQFRDALEQVDTPLDWENHLALWVKRIVADPDYVPSDRPPVAEHEKAEDAKEQREQREQLVVEYLTCSHLPPVDKKGNRQVSLRERVWSCFEYWFRDEANPTRDPALEPFGRYRARATNLNYHFSGLYRGAFVSNYTMAVFAVLLATLSLVLIVKHVQIERHEIPAGAEAIASGAGPTNLMDQSLLIALEVLVSLKLLLLFGIALNTSQANKESWNNKAIDYRYLAERMRSMFYLPRTGSFRSPAANPLNYASRFARQSSVDWLFDAIARSVSPAVLARQAGPTEAPGQTVPTLKLDIDSALADVRSRWIGVARDRRNPQAAAGAGQILYHQRNGLAMGRMHEALEKWVHGLNIFVIAVVAVDLIAVWLHLDPEDLLAPWLIFAAAVLPAAVASLNGLRFQSECQRLADRSKAILRLLEGQATKAQRLQSWIKSDRANPATGEGAYTMKVLALTEGVARDLVEEVAEWSVLYAKDVTHT